MSLRGQAAIIGIGELPTQRGTPGGQWRGCWATRPGIAIQDATSARRT